MITRHQHTGLIDIHQRGGPFGCYPISLELSTCRCGMMRV